MTPDYVRNDPLLVALAQLERYDVDHARARRLCARCHSALAAGRRRADAPAMFQHSVWRRTIGPALAGAWCAIYLMQIVWQAAAIYGL